MKPRSKSARKEVSGCKAATGTKKEHEAVAQRVSGIDRRVELCEFARKMRCFVKEKRGSSRATPESAGGVFYSARNQQLYKQLGDTVE